uniref:RBR-type E3 ubiquitin transferase n=1 Tax=Phallusia mammillata TaxID=59560 RepID=A0A6F9D7H2_9ASCI|nr:E3 ubiquitin-protein ligase ARIH2 [Phallusia mammillata]
MADSDEDFSDDYDDEDINDYYNNNDDYIESDENDADSKNEETGIVSNNNNIKKRIQELEHFQYETFTTENVKAKLLNDMETASGTLNISPSLARIVLHHVKWKLPVVSTKCSLPSEKTKLLVESGVQCRSRPNIKTVRPKEIPYCGVCLENFATNDLYALSCKHMFCEGCWKQHIGFAVKDGMSSGIPCMENNCTLLCHEDFVHQFLSVKSGSLESNYLRHLLRISVMEHYQLRFCPGADCDMTLYAEKPKPRKVQCSKCKYICCFECGHPYHTPADCSTIQKWLTKCADDSETANYISANTKDCPACHICIEKNGGCNHIQCSKCKHNFCWMCLGDWKNHGNSYYECSRYKENPKIAKKSQQTQAREALKKYLFYFQRWENHNQSLMLEAQARTRIQKQIEEKVNKCQGTWIDWQYLMRAGELLAKCRYTLQYTYPLVYYAEAGPEKTLFEYQQAQLEVEIEGLAWKLEHAGDYQRGEIENQMDVAEKRRQTLLARFVSD